MVWQQSACVTCGHPGVRGVHQVFGSSTVIQVEATANFASFFFFQFLLFSILCFQMVGIWCGSMELLGNACFLVDASRCCHEMPWKVLTSSTFYSFFFSFVLVSILCIHGGHMLHISGTMGPNLWVTLAGTAVDLKNAKFGKIRVTRPMLTRAALIFISLCSFF